MSPLAHVVHYTDAGCPFAWNSEPMLLHLQWRYGGQLSWETVMVGLADTPEVYAEKGMTPEVMNPAWLDFAENYPMPLNAEPRERVGATGLGCRAVVAAQLHAPAQADGLLRALRVHFFAGDGYLDEDAMIAKAAATAGLDPAALASWIAGDDVSSIYDDHTRRARHPSPEAPAQNARLASWPGGRRYTCPSLEVTRTADGARLSAPGYQLWMTYEMLFANLLPEAEQRPDAETAREVLDWVPYPAATAEVAQLRGITRDQAREELVAAGATEHRIGSDALWT